MKKFTQLLSSSKSKALVSLGSIGFGSHAMATPVTVDLAEATTSITNAGTAMVTLALVILGFALVIGFISRRK